MSDEPPAFVGDEVPPSASRRGPAIRGSHADVVGVEPTFGARGARPWGVPDRFGVTTYSADQLAAAVFPPRRVLAAGPLLLHEQEFVILYGESDGGKSMVAACTALRAAADGKYVEYFQAEGSPCALQARMEGLARVLGIPGGLAALGDRLILHHMGYPILEANGVDSLSEPVGNPDLIVVDPLSDYFSGNENAAEDARAFVRKLRRWRDDFKTTVVLIHHVSKATNGVPSRLRGSSAIAAAADAVFRVDRVDTAEGLTNRITCMRARDGEKAPAVEATFTWELEGPLASAEWQPLSSGPTQSMVGRADRRPAILDLLRRHPSGLVKSHIAKEIRCSGEALALPLRQLAEAGQIVETRVERKDNKGRTKHHAGWRISDIASST